jgi:poly-gamma-glutamate synthesis protein (capsule biosynthesis protein)
MKQIFFFHLILWFLIISLLTLFDFEKTGNAETISKNNERQSATTIPSNMVTPIIIFMCGDVMIGRGIDQVLPHPSDPLIHEPFMRSARGYVDIAEQVNGPIPRPVSYSYIWGDALEEWERVAPDVRILNLETSVTESDDYWQGKSIHYRMHPDNIPAITAARIDFCSLANNHILDWGYSGLRETLETLRKVDIKFAGAGKNLQGAGAPAVIEVKEKGRVIVFSIGAVTSGIPREWVASSNSPGVNLIKEFSDKTVRDIKERVREVKREGDVVIASIHWGGNWGYRIPFVHVEFAHNLIDLAGVDVIHGHSSHHVRPIEVYKNKPILYGCGDFLNDYEGISGHEEFRDDLVLMYFISMDQSSGSLVGMRMTPLQIKTFKLNRASSADVLWLKDTLNRECKKYRTKVELNTDNTFTLRWD